MTWVRPRRPDCLLGQLSERKALAELLANSDAFIHPNPHEPFGVTPSRRCVRNYPSWPPRGITAEPWKWWLWQFRAGVARFLGRRSFIPARDLPFGSPLPSALPGAEKGRELRPLRKGRVEGQVKGGKQGK